jgi:hypothetical protein
MNGQETGVPEALGHQDPDQVLLRVDIPGRAVAARPGTLPLATWPAMTSCMRSSRALDNPPVLIARVLRAVSPDVPGYLGAVPGNCATAVPGASSAVEAAAVVKSVRRSSPDPFSGGAAILVSRATISCGSTGTSSLYFGKSAR